MDGLVGKRGDGTELSRSSAPAARSGAPYRDFRDERRGIPFTPGDGGWCQQKAAATASVNCSLGHRDVAKAADDSTLVAGTGRGCLRPSEALASPLVLTAYTVPANPTSAVKAKWERPSETRCHSTIAPTVRPAHSAGNNQHRGAVISRPGRSPDRA